MTPCLRTCVAAADRLRFDPLRRSDPFNPNQLCGDPKLLTRFEPAAVEAEAIWSAQSAAGLVAQHSAGNSAGGNAASGDAAASNAASGGGSSIAQSEAREEQHCEGSCLGQWCCFVDGSTKVVYHDTSKPSVVVKVASSPRYTQQLQADIEALGALCRVGRAVGTPTVGVHTRVPWTSAVFSVGETTHAAVVQQQLDGRWVRARDGLIGMHALLDEPNAPAARQTRNRRRGYNPRDSPHAPVRMLHLLLCLQNVALCPDSSAV